jgi:hypothetical protein
MKQINKKYWFPDIFAANDLTLNQAATLEVSSDARIRKLTSPKARAASRIVRKLELRKSPVASPTVRELKVRREVTARAGERGNRQKRKTFLETICQSVRTMQIQTTTEQRKKRKADQVQSFDWFHIFIRDIIILLRLKAFPCYWLLNFYCIFLRFLTLRSNKRNWKSNIFLWVHLIQDIFLFQHTRQSHQHLFTNTKCSK